jgi:ribulose-phosphate 3-epimerase
MIIAPSILAMDFAYMKESLALLATTKATWLHVDVMDGHFVPNLSFGPSIVKSVKAHTQLFMDVHIMVSDPHTYADVFIQAGAQQITFHVEACQDDEDIEKLIKHIHQQGVQVGLTLKPKTPIERVLPFISQIDTILIMSVEPGFGGQAFIPEALHRITKVKQAIDASGRNVHLQVDGGINLETGLACVQAGCDVLVAGSYVFNESMVERIDELWEKSQRLF